MINSLIVEDDLMAQRSLERLCQKIEDIHIVTSCNNVDDALQVLNTEDIDLIFLDIEMGDSTGFQLLDKSPVMPEVIITSSKEEYAFQAFQYEISQYLKKPITLPLLKLSINKLRKKIESKKTTERSDNIFIRSEGKYVNIRLDDIYYIENVGDYARIHLENKKHIIHGTLKKLIAKLPSDNFMKVHRSYIVNLQKIKDIEDNSLLVGRSIIPVSRANKSILIKKLKVL